MLFCILGLAAQTPKADPPKAEAKATKPVSDADRADLRELQMRVKDLQRALQDAQQALVAKVTAITPKEYQLQENQQGKLEFVPLPEPPKK